MKGKVTFMAREFATSEIIRQKCSICGSKNKLYTEIQYKGLHYGYMLTCCNCGHVDIFMDSLNGPSGLLDSLFQKGKEICIQLTTCKKTECKFHGKSSLWDAKTTLDEAFKKQNGENIDSSNTNDLTSETFSCPCRCPGTLGNSNDVQLDINGCNETYDPRFH